MAANIAEAQPVVVNPVGASERLGVNTDTLKRWRRKGVGPIYVRVAYNRVVYRVSDLDEWLDARAVAPGPAPPQ